MANKNISNFVAAQKEMGKFIQVYFDNAPFIRFGSDTQHRVLLEDLLKEFGIKIIRDNQYNPIKKGDKYELVGAGFYYCPHCEKGLFKLDDNSMTYHINPNQEHLDKLKQYLPEGIRIEIDNRK
jgi:hypothetical protein